MIRHLPNLLSGLRLLAAPFAAWAILSGHDIAALLVFAAAGLSDGLDGFIARHWGVTSNAGAWLDPVADKLLMLLCFLSLLAIGVAPLWLTALVVGRDLVIVIGWTAVRLLALPIVTAPLVLGKLSTVVQLLYVFAMLLLLAFGLQAPRASQAAAWACGLCTLLSAGAYARLFWRGVQRPMAS